jgi:RNA polymerase sigma-70 factor (ECF subfamily)
LATRPSERIARTFSPSNAGGDGPIRSEVRLVADAKRGDGEAFGELCRLHRSLMLRVARRVMGNVEDAQDAVQDSLMRAFVAIASFDERAKFRTWLTRITINSCLMLLRKRRSGTVGDSGSCGGGEIHVEEVVELGDVAPSPEAVVLTLERHRALRKAVKRLPEVLRSVIECGHLEERAPVEFARLLGISHGAAKARQFRAVAALRNSRFLAEIANAGQPALQREDAA